MQESSLDTIPYENAISKVRGFFESRYFIVVLGLLTILTWKLEIEYVPYILLCCFIIVIALLKAKPVSALGLYMLYLAGNKAGEIRVHGPQFIAIVVLGIIAAILTVWRFCENFRENIRKVFTNRIVQALLLLIVAMLISIINSPVKVHSLAMTGTFALNVLVSAIVICGFENDEENFSKLVFTMAVFVLVIGVEMIFMFFELMPSISKWDIIKGKHLDLGWSLGNHYVMILNLALILFQYKSVNQNILKKTCLLFLTIIALLLEIFTLSRGGMIGFIVTFFVMNVYLLMSNKKIKKGIYQILCLIGIGFIISIILARFDILDKVIDSLKETGLNENGRMNIWKFAYKNFKENWVIGTGWGTSKYYLDNFLHDWVANYHNFILQISTCGIIGIIFFVIYLIVVVKSHLKKNMIDALLLMIVCYFIIHGSVDTSFFNKSIMPIFSMFIIYDFNKHFSISKPGTFIKNQ